MSALPIVPVAVAPGPAAAVASVPTLTLPSRTLSTVAGAMMRRTISVAVPPSCRPALAPPMLYMAGGDHLPLKFLPSRQLIGPRPPLPPTPTANFFTLGRIMTQSAFATTLAGTSLLPSMACSTVAAFLMVSSSLLLSAPHMGRANNIDVTDTSKTIFLVMVSFRLTPWDFKSIAELAQVKPITIKTGGLAKRGLGRLAQCRTASDRMAAAAGKRRQIRAKEEMLAARTKPGSRTVQETSW